MRLVSAALLLAVSVSPALAQREPVIVIPGKPGVPVYINGIDASWGVVEGEFGLDRPGLMAPIVIYRPLLVALPTNVPGYHPTSGKRPGYGRLEVQPPADRAVPPPAPTFFRSWSSGSAPGPVTDYSAYPTTPMTVEPYIGYGGRRWNHRPGHKPDWDHKDK
jgi:hypothetical protein